LQAFSFVDFQDRDLKGKGTDPLMTGLYRQLTEYSDIARRRRAKNVDLGAKNKYFQHK